MRKFQQALNVGMKKSLGFCGCLSLCATRAITVKVMQIGVHIAIAASGIAIAHPSFAESSFPPPRQGSLEICNSGLQDGEFSFQFFTKPCPIPACEGGVEVGERLKDDGAELGRSVTVGNIPVSSKQDKPGNQSSDDVDVPSHDLFLLLLPLFILLAGGGYSMKHNVEGKGRALARPT